MCKEFSFGLFYNKVVRVTFNEFRKNTFRDQVEKSGFIFSIMGSLTISLFASIDHLVLEIPATIAWRILGIIPLIIFQIFYWVAKITRSKISPEIAQVLGVLMVFGATGMMAALLYKVVVNHATIHPVVLAGTIAGNFVALFAGGLLRGLHPSFMSIAMALPYMIIVFILGFFRETELIIWIFVGNVLVAIPLVIVAVWQYYKGETARLRALLSLQQERGMLEKAVRERTKELEIVIKELHHRVRNNLQMILSIISLYEQDSSYAFANKKIRVIRRAIRVIAYAHELTHNDQISETVSMKSFFDEICSEDYWEDEQVTIKRDVKEASLKVEIAVVIGLVCLHFAAQAKRNCRITFRPGKSKSLVVVTADSVRDASGDALEIPGLLTKLIDSEIYQNLSDNEIITKITIPAV